MLADKNRVYSSLVQDTSKPIAAENAGTLVVEKRHTSNHRLTGEAASLSWQSESGEQLSATAEVLSTITDGIVVEIPNPVASGQTVSVHWDCVERRAEVYHCEKKGSGFLVILRFLPRERRKADRLPTGGVGTLHWCNRAGTRKVVVVRVRDIGPNGIQVESPEPLSMGEIVRLSGETLECTGQIRYCRPEGARFVAGIRFSRPPYPKKL